MKRSIWIAAGWVGAVAHGAAPAVAPENAMNAMTAAKPGATPAAAAPTHFVKRDAIDFRSVLPAPPAAGSLAAQVDLEAVLQVQAWRTPEQVAWAKVVEKDSVYNLAGIVGAWFTAENLPVTKSLFSDVGDDLRALDAASKQPFLRPRPSAVDASVQPCVALPASTSYPSGSAMQAFVWAEILAEIFPAKREELLARAHRAAWGRVIGGVHFPSDVAAGRRLAEVYLAQCRTSAAFRDAVELSRKEMAGWAGK